MERIDLGNTSHCLRCRLAPEALFPLVQHLHCNRKRSCFTAMTICWMVDNELSCRHKRCLFFFYGDRIANWMKISSLSRDSLHLNQNGFADDAKTGALWLLCSLSQLPTSNANYIVFESNPCDCMEGEPRKGHKVRNAAAKRHLALKPTMQIHSKLRNQQQEEDKPLTKPNASTKFETIRMRKETQQWKDDVECARSGRSHSWSAAVSKISGVIYIYWRVLCTWMVRKWERVWLFCQNEERTRKCFVCSLAIN